MALSFYSVKCPECGASLSIEEGRQELFCSYCGTKVIVSNENEYTYRHIDEAEIKQAEAEIKQAETDRMIRLRELEMEESQNQHSNHIRKILTYMWIGAIIVIAIICISVWLRGDGLDAFFILFYVGAPVVCGGAYLVFKVLPDKDTDKKLIKRGGIVFPNLEPFSDKNYESVQNALLHAGFKNIVCINLHDIRIGLLQKPGKIDSISVNGKEILSGGRVYMPDDQITITYHGR